jgi:hypothetical protein
MFAYERVGDVRRAVHVPRGTKLQVPAVLPGFTVKPDPPIRRLVLIDVSISGPNSCGSDTAPEPCKTSCGTASAWHSLQQVDRFFRLLSRGKHGFVLDRRNVFSATIAPPSKTLDIPLRVEEAIGNKAGDTFVYLLPDNYSRDLMDDEVMGLAQTPGRLVLVRDCSPALIAHELGHNWGMSHAGTPSQEYGDLASIMGQPDKLPGLMRGASAPQLRDLGWMSDRSIRQIRKDGTYQLRRSLSSNAPRRKRAARIEPAEGKRALWVEWREAVNQDIDLRTPLKGTNPDSGTDTAIMQQGPLLGSLLVRTREEGKTNSVKTKLLAVLAPGKSALLNGVTITALPDHSFRVSGIGKIFG